MASTVVKVAFVGCVVIVIGVAAAIGIGGYFLKKTVEDKYEKVKNVAGTPDSEYGKKTAQLTQQHPFTSPANGIVTEDQLQRFLEVRKSVFAVYKKYESEFKKMEADKKQGFDALMKVGGIWNEVRMTQVNALEAQRMSPEEYNYIVVAVYKGWLAKGAKETLKGQTLQQSGQENLQNAIDSLEKQIDDPSTSEETKKQLMATRKALEQQKESLTDNAAVRRVDAELAAVPEENIALFTRYKSDIEKYSMAGLELIGL